MVLAIFHFLFSTFAVAAHANTSGAQFLKLGDGSRPLAMGDAYAAVPGDVDSLYHNPGAMPWARAPEFSFTHAQWIDDTNFDIASYAHPSRFGTFGISAMHMGGSDLEGRDINRQATGNFTAEDVACLISYSHTVGSSIGVGGNAKYLRSRIANESASSVALDAGATGRIPGMPLWLGAAVLNMGSGLRFEDQVDRLPLTVSFGSAYQVMKPFLLTLDLDHEPYDKITELHAGGEYSIGPFSFRLGYLKTLQGEDETLLSGVDNLRGGIGIHGSRYRADYALAPFGDLGLTQRFTVGVAFGAESEQGPHNLKTIAASKDPITELAQE